jgi:chondroitin 4-sulfotransferase 11
MNRELIFMHIPKTGGASIGQLCMSRGIAAIGHDTRNPNYISLAQYRRRHPDIYSFALVRNPWDRLVSAYHFLSQGGLNPPDRADADRYVRHYTGFNEFVSEAFRDDSILGQIHFRPQHEWISDENAVIADYVGRFEELQHHVSAFLALAGLPDYKLQHVNRARHKHYKQYYSRQSIDIVRDIYARDIELFGYEYGD